MKRRQVAVLTALIFVIFLSISTVSASIRTVTIRVKGMTCGGCATTVERALKSTEGVEDAQVSFERGRAVIKYDDQKVTVAKLREVINSTGFTCDTR